MTNMSLSYKFNFKLDHINFNFLNDNITHLLITFIVLKFFLTRSTYNVRHAGDGSNTPERTSIDHTVDSLTGLTESEGGIQSED